MQLSVDYRKLIVSPETTLKAAMELMTATSIGFLMIADSNRKLLGVVADSDFRKAVLNGHPLADPVSSIMTKHPLVAPASASRSAVQSLFHKHGKSCIPLVGIDGEVLGLALMAEYVLSDPAPRQTKIVIMAGGRGSRLQPITNDKPKPMVPVGGKPVLEWILERLIAHGFSNFAFSVNYLAEQVIDYFGDGSRWNAKIEYLREERSMGTAGSLTLLNDVTETILVMNADLMTNLNFGFLADYHQQEGALATACVRQFTMQVPYGVVDMDEHRLQGIQEKPTLKFFVNAGIYVLQSEVLGWLPRNSYYDMPSLLSDINERRPGSVVCFPVQEYWLDIGRLQDYDQAQKDHQELLQVEQD